MGRKRNFTILDNAIDDLRRQGYSVKAICNYIRENLHKRYEDEIGIKKRRDRKKLTKYVQNKGP